MTVKAEQRGSSLDAIEEPKVENKPIEPVRPKSKQTIEIGRKALARVKSHCTAHGISFQDFAIRGINRELEAVGEPTVEEIEAGK